MTRHCGLIDYSVMLFQSQYKRSGVSNDQIPVPNNSAIGYWGHDILEDCTALVKTIVEAANNPSKCSSL